MPHRQLSFVKVLKTTSSWGFPVLTAQVHQCVLWCPGGCTVPASMVVSTGANQRAAVVAWPPPMCVGHHVFMRGGGSGPPLPNTCRIRRQLRLMRGHLERQVDISATICTLLLSVEQAEMAPHGCTNAADHRHAEACCAGADEGSASIALLSSYFHPCTISFAVSQQQQGSQ